MRLVNESNRYDASWGPGPASGWYWTPNAGAQVGGGGRGRHDLDEAAHAGEVAQDRRLDAEVVRDDVEHGVGIAGGVRLLGGDACDEVAAVGRRRRRRRRAHDGLVGAERAR